MLLMKLKQPLMSLRSGICSPRYHLASLLYLNCKRWCESTLWDYNFSSGTNSCNGLLGFRIAIGILSYHWTRPVSMCTEIDWNLNYKLISSGTLRWLKHSRDSCYRKTRYPTPIIPHRLIYSNLLHTIVSKCRYGLNHVDSVVLYCLKISKQKQM